ncbi:MAG: IgGFc-binding protein [Deltaproteobacteria bacterium]|nr:IgGFc-binding protein [Deltaproteobacteria bacterium]
MRSSFGTALASFVVAALALAALPGCPRTGTTEERDAYIRPFNDAGEFFCAENDSTACVGNLYFYCVPDGEFLRAEQTDCAATEQVCLEGRGCAVCRPDSQECFMGQPAMCNSEGTAWIPLEECDTEGGEVCREGRCQNLCAAAEMESSYVGCEFYAVDLDNAAIGAGRDASSQQYAVVVSNPGFVPSDVTVEVDTAIAGEPTAPRIIQTVTVPPGDLEILRLPRREVDGASSLATCATIDDDACAPNESCWCRGGVRPGSGADDCRCRTSQNGTGLNDGTHSAVTSNAYRITSTAPLIAYQFNPLDNVGVFSNDASLLLPTSAVGETYTVVGWPQTIANSTDPIEDFDPSSTDEDLRAFLTIVGTAEATNVHVTLGPAVRSVVSLEAGGAEYGPGATLDVVLGAFDVLNLETHGFNGDFTGTLVEANERVSVFSGSEASDAPRFTDLANRRCCADHLEEQLFPDATLGRRFFIGRSAPRSTALNRAFVTSDSVGDFNEPEYARIVATVPGTTIVTTSLPPPEDYFEIEQFQSLILVADQDMEINTDSPVAVLQVTASQEAVGIPNQYPGGDPDIIAVPPVEQYREDYVFLTPQYYAFDFLTVIAPYAAEILLDEMPLDPDQCPSAPADGRPRRMDDPPPEWVVYRCQLSYPDVIGLPNVRVEDGDQNDGYHTLRATARVSIIVSGFDAFVSYAYAGGLNLDPIM